MASGILTPELYAAECAEAWRLALRPAPERGGPVLVEGQTLATLAALAAPKKERE